MGAPEGAGLRRWGACQAVPCGPRHSQQGTDYRLPENPPEMLKKSLIRPGPFSTEGDQLHLGSEQRQATTQRNDGRQHSTNGQGQTHT